MDRVRLSEKGLRNMGGDFEKFLRRRGFDPERVGPFFRRMFVDCWTQPTFRDFWRVWNPVYGFFLAKLYVVLGGGKRPALASAVVFLFAGWVLHDLPMTFVLGRPQIGTTCAFAVWWTMILVQRPGASSVGRAVFSNIARVVVGIALGVAMQRLAG